MLSTSQCTILFRNQASLLHNLTITFGIKHVQQPHIKKHESRMKAEIYIYIYIPSSLFKHIEHVGLENVIDSLNTNASTALRHCKYINDTNSVLIHELSQHQAHDLHGNPSSP